MEKMIKQDIQLIALDMDGTLFNNRGVISERDQRIIRKASESGVAVAVATGRACSELPLSLLSDVGIHYAITGNGGAIYRIPEKQCLFSECMDTEFLCEVIEKLLKLDVYFDIYVDGLVYCPSKVLPMIRRMDMPEAIHEQIFDTRIPIDDLVGWVKEHQAKAEKVTVNFALLEAGTYLDREATAELLDSYPQINYLCGGYHNLEFTLAGVTKGKGLHFLAESLGIAMEKTMACGDSENDLAMLREAQIAVAMANAMEEVKKMADFVTLSNEENGVSYAIEKLIL
ncbi:MAG: Cof-type HAD-IIB family hydrolase [Lachnospiraceae bacterium]